MKQKLTFLLILIAIVITSVNAQEIPATDTISQDLIVTEQPIVVQAATQPTPQPKQKMPAKNKFYYGGYVNASFGVYTSIGVEPMIGYKLTPKLSVGAKIRYDYISDNRFPTTYNTSNYGGSLFSRYRIIPSLYVHVEYMTYNYDYYNGYDESQRQWVPFLLLGAGYSQMVGNRTWLTAQILFDVLQNDHSPYRSWEPFYSVGVGVGF